MIAIEVGSPVRGERLCRPSRGLWKQRNRFLGFAKPHPRLPSVAAPRLQAGDSRSCLGIHYLTPNSIVALRRPNSFPNSGQRSFEALALGQGIGTTEQDLGGTDLLGG